VDAKKEGFDARAVANSLLDLADTRSIRLTNLHLQKVVYFAHGNYWHRNRLHLVVNRFEAWDHGPVVSELYHALKKFGDKAVLGRAERFDFELRDFILVHDIFDASVTAFLDEMLLFYGRMDPWELVKLSHEPGGAWAETIAKSHEKANFALVISQETIATCFGRSRGSNLQ